MEDNNEQITAEQYLLHALKQQIGERYANYEEAIAGLQTQLAMAKQRILDLEEQQGDGDVEEEGSVGAP